MLLTWLRLLLPEEEEEVWFLCPLLAPQFFHGSHLFLPPRSSSAKKLENLQVMRFEGATTLPKINSGGGSDDRRRREGIANDLLKLARATHFLRPSLAI